MAGAQDSPEGRRARQEAGTAGPDGLGDEVPPRPARARAARGRVARPGRRAADRNGAPDDDGEVMVADRPQARHPYGRRDGVPNAMVASAARIGLQDRRAIENTRRRRQAWQTEAWDYFDEVGEIGYTDTFLANLMSKLRLYPAVRLDPKEAPIAVDDPSSKVDRGVARLAVDTLARLRSVEGGQSAILRELSLNLEVAGECYLHGHVEVEGEGDPNEPVQMVPSGDPGAPELPNPNDVEDWQIRSVDELVIVGDSFSLRRGPGVKMLDPLPDSDLVVRIWERHPRFSEMATCAMRRVLAECEALLLLSREVRATSKSRLSNGILLIPSELSFGAIDPTRDPGDGEETDDPFDAELQEAMITPIQEEGSASAVVPLTLRGPAEFLQHVNHLVLDKSLDPVLDARIEQRVLRIARGLNMPVEVTTGLMSTTFANALQVKRSEFEDHIEPRAVLVCDAITSGYFQWALESAGVEPEQAREIFVWFDPSAVVESPDPVEQAAAAHKDLLISDQAYRRYLGYSEEDKPDDDEKLLRLLLNAPRMDPTMAGQIMVKSGLFPDLKVNAPAAGVLGDSDPVSSMPTPGAPPTPPAPKPVEPGPAPAALPPGRTPAEAPAETPARGAPARGAPGPAVAAAGDPAGWPTLGATLVGIDAHLRGRILAKLDEAMHTTLERAGNRLRSRMNRDKGALGRLGLENTPPAQLAARVGVSGVKALGVSDSDLLDGSFVNAVDSVMAWLAGGQEAALRAVGRVVGPLPEPTRQSVSERQKADLLSAQDWLVTNLRDLAAQRLYAPRAKVGPGEDDGTVAVPTSLVRAVLGVAGGADVRGGTLVTTTVDPIDAAGAWADVAGAVTDAEGDPLGGIGVGPTTMGVLSDAGGGVTSWTWTYGGAVRREFEPHLEIDGQSSATPGGFVWGSAYQGFPGNDNPFPGDHDGCMCDITPVMGPAVATPVGAVEAEAGRLAELFPGGSLEPASVLNLTDLQLVANSGRLPADDAAWQYFYRAAANPAQLQADLADGVAGRGGPVMLTKDPTTGRGPGGFAIVRVPAGQAADIGNQQFTVDRVPRQDVVRIERQVNASHGLWSRPEDATAQQALDHQGQDASFLPVQYRHWSDLAGAEADPVTRLGVFLNSDELASPEDLTHFTPADVAARRQEVIDRFGEPGAQVVQGISDWTGGTTKFEEMRGPNPDANARALFDALAKAPLTETDLYRGIGFDTPALAKSFKDLKVGDVIPVRRVSSFSESEVHSEVFLADLKEGLGDNGGAILHLPPGAGRAINVEALGNTPWEQEWLSGHDLRVVDTRLADDGRVVELTVRDADQPGTAYEQRLADFQKSLASGVRSSQPLGDGRSQLVTYADGRQAVVREVDPKIADQADREVLTARLGIDIGAPVPLEVDLGDGRIASEYVQGTLGRDLPAETRQQIQDSDEARLLGLLDRLTGNVDRDPGNWLVTPEGHVMGLPGLSTFGQDLGEVVHDVTEAERIAIALEFPEGLEFESLFRLAELSLRAEQLHQADQDMQNQDTEQAFVQLGHKGWMDNVLDVFSRRGEVAVGTRDALVAQEHFATAFARAFPEGGRYEGFVDHYTPAEMATNHMTPLMASGGQTGLLVWDHGDGRVEAINLFNTSGNSGAGLELLRQAVAEDGVNYLETYGPYLPDLYKQVGFVDQTVTAFDPKLAPPNWDYGAFDQPDYHTMVVPK